MNTCKHKLQYLSRSLAGPALVKFEAHLQDCSFCRQAVWRASRVDDRIATLYEQLPIPQTSLAKAQVLVFQLRKHKQVGFLGRRGWVLATASLVLVLLGLALVFSKRFDSEPDMGSRMRFRPMEILQNQQAHVLQATSFGGKVLQVPAEGHLLVQFGQDRIGLEGQSQVAVLPYYDEMRLILEQGNLSIQAAKRQPGESLVVQAGAYLIRVVGTRFRVRYEKQGALEVCVGEGEVLVTSHTDEHAQHRLHRGQRLQIALGKPAAVSALSVRSQRELIHTLRAQPAPRSMPPTTEQIKQTTSQQSVGKQSAEEKPKRGQVATNKLGSTQPGSTDRHKALPPQGQPTHRQQSEDKPQRSDLSLYRSWILAGEYDKAQQRLIAYLDKHPTDVDHWWLLAECRRKAQQTQLALEAYQKVITLAGSGPDANRARYHAAVLYQDQLGNQVRASELLRAYLDSDLRLQPLREWAQLRQARCLIAMSQTEQAISVLTVLSHGAKDSSVQAQARLLLTKLTNPK